MSAPLLKRAFNHRSINWLINHKRVVICSNLSSITDSQTSEENVWNKSMTINDIVIPKKIQRGPTDILRALASTVGKDYTAPHYKYHDDPYLTPLSSQSKRSYSLAKESGRKSAKYIMQNYPELFYNDPAEPKVEAFSYKDVYDENTEVNEYDLKTCIARREINNCIIIYNNLKNSSQSISPETIQELLELMCFYNCEDTHESDEFLEEKWFKQNMSEQKRQWKSHGFAEELFNAFPKTSESYCTIIQGMAKYNHAERAYHLYEQMQEKGFRCNVETYNMLLHIVPYLRESSETRWQLIEELMTKMKNENIRPNLGTFNGLLEQICKFNYWKNAKNLAQKVFVEMKVKMGIEPSLASYHHLLNLFCKENSPLSPILYEIMEEIENREFTARHPKDVHFFTKAMEVCQSHLSDIQLAYRVNDLLNIGKNYKLLGDSVKESIYYQNFFKLLCTAENIDKLMEIYNKYVPNIYTPEPFIITDIIQAIDLYEAYHYLPQLWSDIVTFEYIGRSKVIQKLLQIMAKDVKDEKLQKQYVDIVSDIIKRVDYHMNRPGVSSSQTVSQTVNINTSFSSGNEWTGDALGNCLIIFLNGKDIEKAYNVIQKLDSEQNKIIGHPNSESLIKFCIAAIDANFYTYALHCVKYCNNIGKSEIGHSVLKHCEKLNLKDSIKDAFKKACDVLDESQLNSDENH